MNKRFSARNSFVYLLLVLLIILGVGATAKIPIQTYPDASLPTYTIRASAPGMMADLAEEKIRKPLEEAVRELGHIDKITTRSQFGSVQLTVKAQEYIGSDYEKRLNEKIAEVAKRLPGGANSVQVESDKVGDREIGYYLLHGTDLQSLSDLASYTVSEKLLAIPGVSRVELDDNGLENKVELLFRPSMMQLYGVTPGDVIRQLQGNSAITELGAVGEDESKTSIQWIDQASSPQELGKTLISAEKGYVALKLLADIRDLRGSRGEAISLYNGDPFIGLHIYADEVGQINSTRADMLEAIAQINQQGKGAYKLDEFANHNRTMVHALRDFLLLLAVMAFVSAIFVGVWMRQILAGIIAFVSEAIAIGALLGGIWLSGATLNIASLGPIAIFAMLFTGAGIALYHRYARLTQWDQTGLDAETKKLVPLLLLSIIVLALIFVAIFYTDFVDSNDMPALYDALPVFVWGTVALLLVYGLILPTLAGGWLHGVLPKEKANKTNRISRHVEIRWERFVQQRYLPYGLTLAVALLFGFFFHSYVTVEPFLNLAANEMSLSLQMAKGSDLEQAVQSAKAAEQKLRRISEIRDLYTVATKNKLTFHLLLQDKYDRERSNTELNQALEKTLRDIPGTDPYGLVVGENAVTRLEFTIKGPSLNTTKELANQVLVYLRGLTWRDEDGREIITDEKVSSSDDFQHILIRPKPEMFVRHRVNEADVKSQLETYLGEQSVGSVYWNEKEVPITARFPEKMMEHPDQVQNILIRTPNGAVRLADLVESRLGPSLASYEREDGQYVINVSSAISDPRRIESLSYYLPFQMNRTVLIPAGYTIQSGEEIRELEKELSEKKDVTGRFVISGMALLLILLASSLVQRKLRYAVNVVLLLPILSGIAVLGLLMFYRPLNVMAFYGMMAVVAIWVQQAFVLIDNLRQAQENSESLLQGVRNGTSSYTGALATLLASLLIGLLPMTFGIGSGEDDYASFATVLFLGVLVGVWVLYVVVPAVFLASELRVSQAAEFNPQLLKQRVHVWWENYRVRRRDLREWKQDEKSKSQEQKALEKEQKASDKADLSSDDFMPLSQ